MTALVGLGTAGVVVLALREVRRLRGVSPDELRIRLRLVEPGSIAALRRERLGAGVRL